MRTKGLNSQHDFYDGLKTRLVELNFKVPRQICRQII